MRQVLRDAVSSEVPDHLGLAYDAWAPTEVANGKVSDNNRSLWLDKLAQLAVSPDYARSYERWKASFSSAGDRLAEVTLSSRLLIGHGNASGADVGLTVHHTWGVPVIPGSALKGLLAHYVDAIYGPADPGKKPWEQQGDERVRADYQGVTWNRRRIERGPGKVYRALFGAPEASEDAAMRANDIAAGAAAGRVTFHDALYVPDSIGQNRPFVCDVLTPHQQGKPDQLGYYDSSGAVYPNDYTSPIPVAFLTVRPKCRFLLALSGRSEWTELAAQILSDALANWGIGGKTAAGYGIGAVGAWKVPEPRLSATERALAELEKYPKDTLSADIERWLQGGDVAGPMRDHLATPLDAAARTQLELVRVIGVKLDLRAAWVSRLANKKADEQKKARARILIERWDRLFAAGVKT